MTAERKPRSEARRRTRVICVRVTPDEHAAAVRAADALGVTLGVLFRRAAGIEDHPPVLDPAVRDELLARLGPGWDYTEIPGWRRP